DETDVVEEGLHHASADRPRSGPTSSARPATTLATSTTTGPVARPGDAADTSAPVSAHAAPVPPASQNMPRRLRANWRAATAGATTSADISTTPTSCRPIT